MNASYRNVLSVPTWCLMFLVVTAGSFAEPRNQVDSSAPADSSPPVDSRAHPDSSSHLDLSRHHATTFTVFNGLPSDSILTVFQDSVGYLWIGTFDGVVRFDGTEFQVYDQTNTPGFFGHSAQTFVEETDGTIWFGTNNEGLVRVRGTRFATMTIADGLPSNSINALALEGIRSASNLRGNDLGGNDLRGNDLRGNDRSESDIQTLWVGTNNGLVCVVDDQVRRAGNRRFDTEPIGVVLHTERDGLIVASKAGGLYAQANTNPILLSEDTITKATTDSDGTVWFGTQSGTVYTYDGDQLTPVNVLTSPGSPIRAISPARGDAGVWIASSNRLYRARSASDVREVRGDHAFLGYVLKSVYEDRQGNLWIGTRTGGLVRLVPIPFQNLNAAHGLTDHTVNSVGLGDDGVLWIGTDDGLFARRNASWLDNAATRLLAGVRVKHVQVTSGVLYASTISEMGLVSFDGTTVRTYGADDGITSGVVKKSVIDRRGNLWVSTSAGVVMRSPDGAITTFDLQNGFISNEIYDLFEDSRGRMWVSTVDSGVARITDDDIAVFDRSNGLAGDMVFSVREDDEHRFWIATAAGLFVLGHDDTITPIPVEIGLPYVYVYAAQPDGNRLWCTSVRGLNALNIDAIMRKLRESTTAGTPSGAASSGETAIEEMPVEEPRGDAVSAVALSVKDGLLAPPNALSWPFLHPDGRVFVSTHRGLSIFEPWRVTPDTEPWPTLIQQVSLDGREVTVAGDGAGGRSRVVAGDGAVGRSRDVAGDGAVAGAPAGRGIATPGTGDPVEAVGSIEDLHVSFSALDLGSPHEITYQHRLIGYSDTWSPPRKAREATYRRLSPGTYRFAVRAVDASGVVRGSAYRTIIVRPTITQTVAFRVAATMALILTAAYLVFLKVRAATRHRKRLEHEVALRTAELEESHRSRIALIAQLSHEIRNPLTVLLHGLDSARRRTRGESIGAYEPVLETMKRNAHRVLFRLGQLLGMFRLELDEPEVHPSVVALDAVLDQYRKDFTIVAEEHEVAFQVDVDTDSVGTVVIDPHHLETILLNLLTNAFSHTPQGGTVTLEARRVDDRCMLVITDTGSGIDRTLGPAEGREERTFASTNPEHGQRHLSSGLGMNIVRKLVDAVGGALDVDSTPGTGTRIACTLPCRTAAAGVDGPTIEQSTPLLDLYTSQIPTRSDPPTRVVRHNDPSAPLVLIVEDDRDMVPVLIDELSPECSVAWTSDGAQALKMLHEDITPHVIVTDVMMPGMDGIEFFRRLREDQRLERIPVLFLTAKASPEEQIDALHDGAIDYILKPYQPGCLLLRVRNLLNHVDRAVADYKESIRSHLMSVLEDPHQSPDTDGLPAARTRPATSRPAVDARLAATQPTAHTRPTVDEIQLRFGLTRREARIVMLVLQGHRDKEIAAELHVATSTISNTLSRIYHKVGAGGRVELVSTVIGNRSTNPR